MTAAPGGPSAPEGPALRVLGDERALALAGLAGEAPAGAPTVHLGPITDPADHLGPTDPAEVVWLPGPADAPPPDGTRLIATSGEGLWSRAPWPARDDLFELGPAPRPLVLVAGGPDEAAEHVMAKLAERRLPAVHAPELTAFNLEEASVVVLLGPADAATDEEPLRAAGMPAEAPAVLAARRILIAPRCEATFGLLPGIDHLAFSSVDDAVHYADAVVSFPESFEPFPALGRVAAEPHRASRVYARLADEL